jgi:hypothetical protein
MTPGTPILSHDHKGVKGRPLPKKLRKNCFGPSFAQRKWLKPFSAENGFFDCFSASNGRGVLAATGATA